jgi:preprotein translocase subunit SecE
MRVDPVKKTNLPMQVRINNITRVVAIVVAFLSTFIFFIKILFF